MALPPDSCVSGFCASWRGICGETYSGGRVAHSTRPKDVTLVSYVFPPFANACFPSFPGPNCSDPGQEVKIAWRIVDNLGFAVKWLRAASEGELLDALANGTADMSAITQVFARPGEEPTRLLETSVTVLSERTLFVTAAARNASLPVSLLFGEAATACAAALSWYMATLYKASSAVFWVTLGVLLGLLLGLAALAKRLRRPPLEKVFAAALTSFSLGLAVCLGMYSNTLAITLSRPSPSAAAFATLTELSRLVRHRQCRFVANRRVNNEGNFLYQFVNPTGSEYISLPLGLGGEEQARETVANLREAFVANPPLWVRRDEDLASAVLRPERCFVGVVYASQRAAMAAEFCGLAFVALPGLRGAEFVYTLGRGAFAGHPAARLLLTSDLRLRHFQRLEMSSRAAALSKAQLTGAVHASCRAEAFSAPESSHRLGLLHLSEPFLALFCLCLVSSLAFGLEYHRQRVTAQLRAFFHHFASR